MKTQAFPFKLIAPNTYEIGEFDCASIFLLVGDEKAMLMDTGVGIGDLKGFVQQLTDKPILVCYTHNHVDHVGGAGAFDHGYIHHKDMADFETGGGLGLSVEKRVGYIKWIAEREKGDYPYSLDVDVTEWGPMPRLYPLKDEQVIDLGNRQVVVYECPGHTAGSITFLDRNTRTLFLGDACNCNLGLMGSRLQGPNFVSVEKALLYLQRLRELGDEYDQFYNGHYDFRDLGQPLPEETLDEAITAGEQIVDGTAKIEVRPSAFPGAPVQNIVKIGNTEVTFTIEGIYEPQ